MENKETKFRFYLNRQGVTGRQGAKGDTGFSPEISVEKDTLSEYILRITNESSYFLTTNLREHKEDRGGTYIRLDRTTGGMYAGEADKATTDTAGIVKMATPDEMMNADENSVVTPANLTDFITDVLVDYVTIAALDNKLLEYAKKVDIQAELNQCVKIFGDQSISGTKVFSNKLIAESLNVGKNISTPKISTTKITSRDTISGHAPNMITQDYFTLKIGVNENAGVSTDFQNGIKINYLPEEGKPIETVRGGIVYENVDSGNINNFVSVDPATVDKAGIVKPDGTSITVDPDGTIHAEGGTPAENLMTLDTDQEVNSSKTFLKDQAMKSNTLDVTTARNERGNAFIFSDKNGTQVAGISSYVNNNGSPECRFIASNGVTSAFAGLGVTKDGQGFFEIPEPAAGSNNNDAVTSHWVHSELTKNYVAKNGDTMTGALKFGTSGYIEANKANSTKGMAFFGSIDGYAEGASLALRDNTAEGSQAGAFKLETGNNVTGHTHTLQGSPNGSFTCDGKEIVRTVNGKAADEAGNVTVDIPDTPVATTSTAGKVKPDGTTITVTADGTIAAVGGGGGDVTKEYVDQQDAKKQDKFNTVAPLDLKNLSFDGTIGYKDNGSTLDTDIYTRGIGNTSTDPDLGYIGFDSKVNNAFNPPASIAIKMPRFGLVRIPYEAKKNFALGYFKNPDEFVPVMNAIDLISKSYLFNTQQVANGNFFKTDYSYSENGNGVYTKKMRFSGGVQRVYTTEYQAGAFTQYDASQITPDTPAGCFIQITQKDGDTDCCGWWVVKDDKTFAVAATIDGRMPKTFKKAFKKCTHIMVYGAEFTKPVSYPKDQFGLYEVNERIGWNLDDLKQVVKNTPNTSGLFNPDRKQGLVVNIGEALVVDNGKISVDKSKLNPFPSNKWITFNSLEYIAPANGYITYFKMLTGNGYVLAEVCNPDKTSIYSDVSQHAGGNAAVLPISKGQVLKITEEGVQTHPSNVQKFIYAEGEI